MSRRLIIPALAFVLVALGVAPERADAVEKGRAKLGASCKTRTDCRSPGATCMAVEGANLCTTACTGRCSAGFSCVVMTVQPKGSTKAVRGYCLPDEMAAQYGQAVTR